MLLRYGLLFIPLVNAWTFRYTNKTEESEIIVGSGEQNCTVGNIAGGKEFSYNPGGASDLCVSLYRDKSCTSRGGYSCTVWQRNASRNFMAFDVKSEKVILSEDQTSTMTSTSMTSTSTSISTTSSPTTTPTPSDAAAAGNANSGSGLSGGAIAGVIIGVVAAVAIIVGLVVFFMKRQKKQTPAPPTTGSYGPHEGGATGSVMSGTTAQDQMSPIGGFSEAAQKQRFMELPGQSATSELGGSQTLTSELGNNSISELDGGSVGQHRS